MPRNRTIIAAAVLVTVLMSLLGAAATTKEAKESTSAPGKIEIRDKKYNPAKLTIKQGQAVLWTNRDDGDHTIVADDGSFGTKDNDLSRGESYRFTFRKKGKFKFHCRYHPREKGEIIVE